MLQHVVLITGSLPPDACGVGDYTGILASALMELGANVDIICHRQWSVAGTMSIIRRIRRERGAFIHMQYPTAGYGHSLGPQLCSIFTRPIVTLHEFSAAHILRKLSIFPLLLRAERVVLTTEVERRALIRHMPWLRERIRVIPVGSNLANSIYQPDERAWHVAYFGLIMPDKGLEQFLEFSRILRQKSYHERIVIVGKVPARHANYAQRLQKAAKDHAIEWIIDRSAAEVSQLLSRSTLCYLPFPDGASDRRGSLKAICSIGLPCITTRGASTPPNLVPVVVFAGDPKDAADSALRLLPDRQERYRLSRLARDYARSYSWEQIAAAHVQLYSELGN